MTGPSIRVLGPDEVEQILPIWESAGLHHRPEGRDSVEALRREAADERSFILGSFDDGRLIGVAVGTDDGRKGWINRVAVHPDHARSGVARSLIEACEQRFRDRGIGVFAVLVYAGNRASRSLFESEGYVVRDDVVYLRKADRRDDW